jgi:hypothetical protein
MSEPIGGPKGRLQFGLATLLLTVAVMPHV